jgi:hypothetical protein
MSEIKYTTDGRKVVVLGALNAQEKIVQEIFVTADGSEIPAGENFVVKSLLDQPAKTWKSRDAEKMEERYLKQKAALEKGEEELRTKEARVLEPLREKIRLLAKTTQELHPDALKILSDFLFGRLKYVVYLGYNPRIENFAIENCAQMESGYGRARFEKLKLISLMGGSDGKLDWRIHTYSDHSGGGDNVHLVATLEEAKAMLVEAYAEAYANAKTYRDEDLAEFAKWGIVPDPEKLEATRAQRMASADRAISEQQALIEKNKIAREAASRLGKEAV